MITLHQLILLAGIGHFGILAASVQVPAVMNWKEELARLHDFNRKLFWVYGVFIVLTIASFGVITLINADALTNGTLLARSIAAFIAVFWAARLVVQCFVFDAKPFLISRLRWLGYHTLTGAFVFFTALYGWLALH
jgi:hypothetical protein